MNLRTTVYMIQGLEKATLPKAILGQTIQKGTEEALSLIAEGTSISRTQGKRGLFTLCHYVNVIILCYLSAWARLHMAVSLLCPREALPKADDPHPNQISSLPWLWEHEPFGVLMWFRLLIFWNKNKRTVTAKFFCSRNIMQ